MNLVHLYSGLALTHCINYVCSVNLVNEARRKELNYISIIIRKPISVFWPTKTLHVCVISQVSYLYAAYNSG